MREKRIIMLISFCLMCGIGFSQFPDTVKIAASMKYENASLFKKFFLGTNYRQEWSTPVTMPVFFIQKVKGGLTIGELGGGMQTKTLELKDKQGNTWALRTVDKEIEKTLPPKLRKTFINRMVQDMISAAHPYAALTVPDLANAIGVHSGSQELFFVPDDPALGAYRELFANQVCMLEQRTLPLIRVDSLETEEVINALFIENNRQLNQKNLLKARLLDMLIADWDRHAGQWKWGVTQTGNIKVYEPLPRDRDQAYFNSNGLLVRMITLMFMPHIRGFKSEPSDLDKLNLKSWAFDKDLLNELDRETWEATVREFQENISDSVIHRAVSRLPKEIYALSGKELEEKLKMRRDGLLPQVLKYYAFLSENVEVNGTDEAEYFNIKAAKDKITVTVFSNDLGDNKRQMYHRVFDKDETNRIFLNGMGENDQYRIDGKITGVKLILDGGEGENDYDLGSNQRIKMRGGG